jgi:FkbM family methyltransferase
MSYSTLTQEQHKDYTHNEWTNYEYFSEVIKYLKEQNIKSFIDIGGCSGEVSKILIEKIPTIKYGLIFEPDLQNYKFIIENVSNKNILVENKAVYYGKDKINLSIKSEWKNIGSWSVFFNEEYPENSIEVQCTELEPYLNKKEYDFIKIDIEGSEFNLLENSSQLRTIKFIELEIHYQHYNVDHKTNKNMVEYLKTYLPNHEIHYYLGEDEKNPSNVFLINFSEIK